MLGYVEEGLASQTETGEGGEVDEFAEVEEELERELEDVIGSGGGRRRT